MQNAEKYGTAVELLPPPIKEKMLKIEKNRVNTIYEIRLYADKTVCLDTDNGKLYVDESGKLTDKICENCIKISKKELIETVMKASEYSPYTHEKELKQGYLTTRNGIRMGLCFETAAQGLSIGDVCSAVMRIPFDNDIVLDEKTARLFVGASPSVLFVGAPGTGKTTLLKMCIAYLSSPYNPEPKRVSVVDERGELADFGKKDGIYFAEIIPGIDKSEGIFRALRLYHPQYIVIDELSTVEQVRQIISGMNSGVSFLASIHAREIGELTQKAQFKCLFRENVFDYYVFLSENSPGVSPKIISREEMKREVDRINDAVHEHSIGGYLQGNPILQNN